MKFNRFIISSSAGKELLVMRVPLARTKRAHLICPYLKRTIMPLCQVKKGSLTAPNVHEIEHYCLTFTYEECPIYRKHHREGRADAL
ncbi:MAG: hypothetical protein ACFFCW_18980 [Candidatus Hodarchaeota archaeon]